MRYIQLTPESGEAYILMDQVVGIVRHEDTQIQMATATVGRNRFDVDLHMKSGTIFVVIDYTKEDFYALLHAWEMFRRPFKDDEVLSPAYIEDGKVREI